jgi:hypothetical protein
VHRSTTKSDPRTRTLSQNERSTERVQCHLSVTKWRHRFAAERLDGLIDEPRLGAARTIGDDIVEAIVVETLETAPPDATHWSTRGLAARHGISHQSVAEIWKAFGLKPWRADEFKISPDPQLIEKTRDIVGLYLNPPVAAAVFAVDEKPQVQALDRSAPTLPMLPGTPARATHDYIRHGTLDLFAALNVATGTVISNLRRSHTTDDFIASSTKSTATSRPVSTYTSSWTTSSPTRHPKCTSGCCATAGSTSTSHPPTAPGSTSSSAGSPR